MSARHWGCPSSFLSGQRAGDGDLLDWPCGYQYVVDGGPPQHRQDGPRPGSGKHRDSRQATAERAERLRALSRSETDGGSPLGVEPGKAALVGLWAADTIARSPRRVRPQRRGMSPWPRVQSERDQESCMVIDGSCRDATEQHGRGLGVSGRHGIGGRDSRWGLGEHSGVAPGLYVQYPFLVSVRVYRQLLSGRGRRRR